ncbi:MAG: hypothetical protein HOP08_00575 [Cyclobacteriaceae bacterium]|nr:hypothetical protein [Cyclobacteriaceae bacterium]
MKNTTGFLGAGLSDRNFSFCAISLSIFLPLTTKYATANKDITSMPVITYMIVSVSSIINSPV